MYSRGLRPLLYSQKCAAADKIGSAPATRRSAPETLPTCARNPPDLRPRDRRRRRYTRASRGLMSARGWAGGRQMAAGGGGRDVPQERPAIPERRGGPDQVLLQPALLAALPARRRRVPPRALLPVHLQVSRPAPLPRRPVRLSVTDSAVMMVVAAVKRAHLVSSLEEERVFYSCSDPASLQRVSLSYLVSSYLSLSQRPPALPYPARKRLRGGPAPPPPCAERGAGE